MRAPTTPGTPTPAPISPTVTWRDELAGLPDWDSDSDIEMPELPPLVALPAVPLPAPAVPEVPQLAPAGAVLPVLDFIIIPDDVIVIPDDAIIILDDLIVIPDDDGNPGGDGALTPTEIYEEADVQLPEE